MGNSDDDSDCTGYGTPLEPIEEDEVARKRPITVAEQIAVDERGRRRFHGAFTGGFSAGYFNTVGSKEGWSPATFKSSRGDRNSFKNQNVLDFMDDEDKGAFGIAPQVLRPTDDFIDNQESRGRKRPWSKEPDGPIPGVPVLEQIIQPVKETIGIKILIRMGWRPGKGVGPKVDKRIKKAKTMPSIDEAAPVLIQNQEDSGHEENPNERVYGCYLPPEVLKAANNSEESEDEFMDTEELLAPGDVDTLLCKPKENSFGLGYSGLDRNALTQASDSVDLFGTRLKFRVENKNLSISGEAFGVGAFEENDDSIYSREDLSQYDFALETPEERKQRKAKEANKSKKLKNKENCIDGFRIISTANLQRKHFPAPPLPPNFQPVHASKKSRFETSSSTDEKQDYAKKGLGRHSLTISERQVLIEDDSNIIPPIKSSSSQVSVSQQPINELSNISKNEPVKSAIEVQKDTDSDIKKRIERLQRFTQVLQAYKKPDEGERASFKPFMKNPEKEERYEKYLTLLDAGFSECLRDLQPPEMTEWEREREKMEFDRASKLYKPMSSILTNRFVSAKSHDISHLEPEKDVIKEKDPKDDPVVAAKMKLFGQLTHRVVEWHPDKLVCKRFNIPHPFPDSKFVGIKPDSATRDKSFNNTVGDTEVIKSVDKPKKSLFDDLDFSKPPPGLLPVKNVESTDFTGKPPESSGGADTVLQFQKEISTVSTLDDETTLIKRPPVDLFKEIFADSSESENEEITTLLETVPKKINQEKKNENQRSFPEHMLREISGRDDNTFDKKTSAHGSDRKSLSTTSKGVELGSASLKRGIFDRIDLDRLQGHELSKNKKVSGNRNRDSDDEDMEDSYGPRPPKTVPTASSSKQNATATPVSVYIDSSVNQLSNSKVSDSRKETSIEEVIWVEKSALSESKSSKSHVKGKKHSSKKSKKKSNKKEKRKSHKSKKHKHKKKAHKHSSKSKRDSGDSRSESDDDSSNSGTSSDSSVTINDSLDNRALLAKLKQITRSN